MKPAPSPRSLLLVLAACAGAVLARGADAIVVTSSADSGAGTLRAAIEQANAAGGGEIVFSGVTGTVTLSSALPTIVGTTTISGPGARLLSISGNRTNRVFQLAGDVTLSGLTILNGALVGANGATGGVASSFIGRPGGNGAASEGGGLLNQGVARVLNCSFATNSATGGKGGAGGDAEHLGGNGGAGGGAAGGALHNLGSLLLSNCTFTGNSVVGGDGAAGGAGPVQGRGYGGAGAPGSGAALYNAAEASAILVACGFTNNSARAGNSAGGTPFDGYNGRPGATGADALGGAICNRGTLSILDCSFAQNAVTGGAGGPGGDASDHQGGPGGPGGAALGAAVYNSGVVGMTNSTLASSRATGGAGAAGGAGTVQGPGAGGRGGLAAGGALDNAVSGVAVGVRCTFTKCAVRAGSSADGAPFEGYNGRSGTDGSSAEGGAIRNLGTTTLVNCTFDDNSATGGNGGGGGDADGRYGGDGGDGGSGYGGNLSNRGLLLAVHCTFAHGACAGGTGGAGGDGAFGAGSPGATGAGYGAQLASQAGRLQLANSILAYPAQAANVHGPVEDLGGNLSSDATPALSRPGSANDLNPLLSTLASNGGTTSTLALQAGSPAIDAASAPDSPSTDQRGVPRPQGVRPDIGSFETVLAAPLWLAPSWQTSAGFSANLFYDSTDSYRIQGTTNLKSWITLTNYQGGSRQVLDPSAASVAYRSYRVVVP